MTVESRELIESPLWWMALDNLEQMFPSLLQRKLASGTLESYLNDLVRQHLIALGKVREATPEMDYEQAKEQVLPTYILRQNPDWQDEKPLPPEVENRLKAFRERMEAKAEKFQDARTTASGETT